MTDTPNHGYNRPDENGENWHAPRDANFTDVELRVEGANLENNTPGVVREPTRDGGAVGDDR